MGAREAHGGGDGGELLGPAAGVEEGGRWGDGRRGAGATRGWREAARCGRWGSSSIPSRACLEAGALVGLGARVWPAGPIGPGRLATPFSFFF